ncbi:hypothetical protein GEMRC1_010290 [Eukaryota sp. GEM-RC1]
MKILNHLQVLEIDDGNSDQSFINDYDEVVQALNTEIQNLNSELDNLRHEQTFSQNQILRLMDENHNVLSFKERQQANREINIAQRNSDLKAYGIPFYLKYAPANSTYDWFGPGRNRTSVAPSQSWNHSQVSVHDEDQKESVVISSDFESRPLKPSVIIAVQRIRDGSFSKIEIRHSPDDSREVHIGDEGAIALADALKVNKSLKFLGLDWNSIFKEGALALGDALKINSTIDAIDLDDNGVEPKIMAVINKISGNRF